MDSERASQMTRQAPCRMHVTLIILNGVRVKIRTHSTKKRSVNNASTILGSKFLRQTRINTK